MAVSSTSWDCRLAQSTHSELLCPMYSEQSGSMLQSDLSLVSWFGAHFSLYVYLSFIPQLPPPPPPSGRPSTPQVTLAPTAGSLRVQLTTMYPGTRESTLQYSISTSTSPRSRRQTGQQTLPVTDLTTSVSGSEEVALDPGTYSVTVTVTNQHGDTMSVPQEVTVLGQYITPLNTCAVYY